MNIITKSEKDAKKSPSQLAQEMMLEVSEDVKNAKDFNAKVKIFDDAINKLGKNWKDRFARKNKGILNKILGILWQKRSKEIEKEIQEGLESRSAEDKVKF